MSDYCSSGSTKKEKTLKRIEIMETSFRDYFELQSDDTLDGENQIAEENSVENSCSEESKESVLETKDLVYDEGELEIIEKEENDSVSDDVDTKESFLDDAELEL